MLKMLLDTILEIILGLKIKSILIQKKKHNSMYVDSDGLTWPYNSLVPPHETVEELIEGGLARGKKKSVRKKRIR